MRSQTDKHVPGPTQTACVHIHTYVPDKGMPLEQSTVHVTSANTITDFSVVMYTYISMEPVHHVNQLKICIH